MADLTPLLRHAHRRNMSDPIFHAKFRMITQLLEVDERLVGDLVLSVMALCDEAAEMTTKGLGYNPPDWVPGQDRARDQLQTLAHIQKSAPEAWDKHFANQKVD